MSLYLCIFDGDDEVDGVEVGRYSDFGALRDTIRDKLEGGAAGSRFPTLMLHSDCDGAWSPEEAAVLEREIDEVRRGLDALPAAPVAAGWQQQVARSLGLSPRTLAECYFDVDGEPLFDRLASLCRTAIANNLPILFQ